MYNDWTLLSALGTRRSMDSGLIIMAGILAYGHFRSCGVPDSLEVWRIRALQNGLILFFCSEDGAEFAEEGVGGVFVRGGALSCGLELVVEGFSLSVEVGGDHDTVRGVLETRPLAEHVVEERDGLAGVPSSVSVVFLGFAPEDGHVFRDAGVGDVLCFLVELCECCFGGGVVRCDVRFEARPEGGESFRAIDERLESVRAASDPLPGADVPVAMVEGERDIR
jgi:hypothetical protein